jgi:RecA-family ATPase
MPKPDLATATLAPVRFVVEPLLPRGFVSLLAGHGDVGKSLLALVIAAHIACGRRFADLACVSGRVLFVSLEDSAELVWLRLRRIADAYELDPATITANVTVLDAPDLDDAALAFERVADGVRGLVFTPAFEQIRARAAGHDLIVVDNGSDAYDANENERRLVRRFVRALQRIARDHDAAMWLLAHIDKAAARYGANGETYSGSTAWHNSARSRMALVGGDSDLEFVHEKCNLAKKLEHPIALERGEHGVPMPVSKAQREQVERADERAVLAAIRAAQHANVIVPTAQSGPRTAVHVLSARPELPKDLADDGKRIKAALTKLEREGAIWREQYKDGYRKSKEMYRCGSSIG